MRLVTGKTELNQLGRIAPAAMDDGIGQCLPESQFHFKVTLLHTVRLPDQLHHTVNRRFYSVYVASNGQLQPMEELLVIQLAGGESFQRALTFLGDEDFLADLGPQVELARIRRHKLRLQKSASHTPSHRNRLRLPALQLKTDLNRQCCIKTIARPPAGPNDC